jgi:hypothetical protein
MAEVYLQLYELIRNSMVSRHLDPSGIYSIEIIKKYIYVRYQKLVYQLGWTRTRR